MKSGLEVERTRVHIFEDWDLDLDLNDGDLDLDLLLNAVVTREIKLFRNYFILRRRPSERILFQRVETCLKLFQNYFRG